MPYVEQLILQPGPLLERTGRSGEIAREHGGLAVGGLVAAWREVDVLPRVVLGNPRDLNRVPLARRIAHTVLLEDLDRVSDAHPQL